LGFIRIQDFDRQHREDTTNVAVFKSVIKQHYDAQLQIIDEVEALYNKNDQIYHSFALLLSCLYFLANFYQLPDVKSHEPTISAKNPAEIIVLTAAGDDNEGPSRRTTRSQTRQAADSQVPSNEPETHTDRHVSSESVEPEDHYFEVKADNQS